MRNKLLRWRWWYILLILALCVGILGHALSRTSERLLGEWPANDLHPTQSGFLVVADTSVTLRDWTTGAPHWSLDNVTPRSTATGMWGDPFILYSWSPSGDRFALLDEKRNAVDTWNKGVPTGHIPLPVPMHGGDTIVCILDDGRCYAVREGSSGNDVWLLIGNRVTAHGHAPLFHSRTGYTDPDMPAVAPDGSGVLVEGSNTYLAMSVSGDRIKLVARDHPHPIDVGGSSGTVVALFPGGVWYDTYGSIVSPRGMTRPAGDYVAALPQPGSDYIAECLTSASSSPIRVMNPVTGDVWSIPAPKSEDTMNTEWLQFSIQTSMDGNALTVGYSSPQAERSWWRFLPRLPDTHPSCYIATYRRPGVLVHRMRITADDTGASLPCPDARGMVTCDDILRPSWCRLYRW